MVHRDQIDIPRLKARPLPFKAWHGAGTLDETENRRLIIVLEKWCGKVYGTVQVCSFCCCNLTAQAGRPIAHGRGPSQTRRMPEAPDAS